jgi:hypothetical protein
MPPERDALTKPSGSRTVFANGQTVRLVVAALRSLSAGALITMRYQSRSAAPGGHGHTPSADKQARKIVLAYLSHTRPLIESDLTECLSGGLPVLMAGDLNAKQTE